MTAAIPQVLVDLGALAGVIIALLTLAALVWKTPPVRWLRQQIARSIADWLVAVIERATDSIRLMAEDSRHRITYHLGSNDMTPPFHERLSQLEEALGLDPVRQQEDPPLFGPHGERRDAEGRAE